MKFADHLSRETIQKFNQMRRKQQKTEEKVKVEKPVKAKEQLSRKDWEEMMGKNRDTYTRRNGAIRRK